jgi:puromycin-sensitive aminopeptidase
MQAFSEGEENFTVWSSVNNCLAKLDSLLAYAEECEGNFKSYARDLMKNIYNKLGWDPQPGESKSFYIMYILLFVIKRKEF